MRITTIIHLLLLVVGFTILLIIFRIFYSGSLMYIFLCWNLFLAAMPLTASTLLLQTKNKNVQWLFFVAWLLFFPNSLYIITDLIHLKDRPPVPFWFDIILVFSAAINGMIIAYLSLQQVEIFLKSKFNAGTTNIVIYGCLFLSSFGIYLGRYLRWNSWDILSNPFGLLDQITQRFINPFDHPRTWTMTIVFTAFFSIFYFTLKKLPNFVFKVNNQK